MVVPAFLINEELSAVHVEECENSMRTRIIIRQRDYTENNVKVASINLTQKELSDLIKILRQYQMNIL